MRIHNEATEAEVSGFGEYTVSQVDTNSVKFFQLMSERLYSDKVRTIVRELLSNAWDAQKEAGTLDTPTKIVLPNALSLQWMIRDYGTGLSKQDVMNLYMNYLQSTKDKSNDSIGGFGLGSKSPFAYTDSFTVTSYYNGKKDLYMMSFDRKTPPKVYHATSENTTEPNGLEIVIPVNKSDLHEFCQKTIDVAWRFHPQPVISGNSQYSYPEVVYDHSGNGWRLAKRSWGRPTCKAVINYVAYDINLNSLNINDRQAQENIHRFLNLPFELDFDIGELSITPDREKLSYDKNTIEKIIKKIEDVTKEFSEMICSDVKHQKTLWDAATVLNKVPYEYKKLFENKIEWKGKPVPGIFHISSHASSGLRELNKVDPHSQRIFEIWEVDHHGVGSLSNRYRRLVNDSFVRRSSSFTSQIQQHAGSELTIVWDYKMDKFWRARVRSTELSENVIVVRSPNKKHLKTVVDAFGGKKHITIDNLEEPIKNGYSGKIQAKVFEVKPRFYGYMSTFKRATVNFKDSGIYVDLYGASIKKPDGTLLNLDNFRKLCEKLESMGIVSKGTKIVGIPKTLNEKPSGKRWVNFFDYIEKEVRKYAKNHSKEIELYHLGINLKDLVLKITTIEDVIKSIQVSSKVKNDFKSLFEEAKKLNSIRVDNNKSIHDFHHYTKPQSLVHLMNIKGYVSFEPIDKFDFENHDLVVKYKEIKNKYEIIEFICLHSGDQWYSVVQDYLNFKCKE